MSRKLAQVFAIIALLVAAPGTALAYHGHWHGGWHGGHWHGGWGWGGPHIYFGGGYPAYYADPYYYDGPRCGWVHIRYWRYGHWRLRRVWRCW